MIAFPSLVKSCMVLGTFCVKIKFLHLLKCLTFNISIVSQTQPRPPFSIQSKSNQHQVSLSSATIINDKDQTSEVAGSAIKIHQDV